MSTNIVMIDASTYQRLIGRLSETLAQKVMREGNKQIAAPHTFHPDIFISMRQAQNTYNFLHWVHSDDLRASVGWSDTYTVACEPLIRNLMDNPIHHHSSAPGPIYARAAVPCQRPSKRFPVCGG